MPFHYPPREGVTKPGAALGRGTRFIGSVETLEYPGRVSGGDTRPLIDDFKSHCPILSRCAQHDGSGIRGVADRIVEEVRKNLMNALGIGKYPEICRFGIDIQAQLLVPACGVKTSLPGDVVEKRPHLELLLQKRDRTGLQPREIEELRYEATQPFDLLQHRSERL